jgi:hypothetical protein
MEGRGVAGRRRRRRYYRRKEGVPVEGRLLLEAHPHPRRAHTHILEGLIRLSCKTGIGASMP